MKIAVIPARGGSKRIPRKNIKEFCGKPMIAYSIEAAVQSGCFDKVIVSTDDNEIADVSRNYGADVPFIRPPELSDDNTGTNAVIAHTIDYYRTQGININIVSCIYATAPFINPRVIKKSIELLETNDQIDFAVSVTKYPYPIQRALKTNFDYKRDKTLILREPEYAMVRSQELDEFYHDAGQIYTGRPDSFIHTQTVFEGAVLPVLLESKEVQDIDTPEDWNKAEFLFSILNKK